MNLNKVYCGNNIEVLQSFPDNSVDSIVTDPPYGLSFMNKHWDYDVPSIELWKECLRVLKPGGHLLSFAGTRTYHRMTVRIEDAGFEIRDMISWIYGSGFPKSLDISKAIDKSRAGLKFDEIRDYLKICIRKSGLSQIDIKKHLKYPDNSGIVSHWVANSQPLVPGWDDWQKMKDILPIDNRYDTIIATVEREQIGIKKSGIANKEEKGRHTVGASSSIDVAVTIPTTSEAIQWNGWGTALKPACEPICVARKPLTGTVAENVLQHGTGGLNIDGCRIESGTEHFRGKVGAKVTESDWKNNSGFGKPFIANDNPAGRFPANIIFDEIAGVMLDEQSGESNGGGRDKKIAGFKNGYDTLYKSGHKPINTPNYADSGGASRFFYCAKASKAERNGGLDGFEEKENMRVNAPRENEEAKHNNKMSNFHPTVKPLKLMQYLVRLVTPPNGICLDPFCGSGTTLMACVKEGFNYIGIEREADYVKIAEARIEWISKNLSKEAEQANLFS